MFLNSPLIFIIFLIQPHTPSSPSSIMSIGAFGMFQLFIWPLAWPSSAAESGKTGAHCLSPSVSLRTGSASLRHRRSRRTAQGPRRATPQPAWFWVLLPKQKACPEPSRRNLVRLGETRIISKKFVPSSIASSASRSEF